MVTTIDILNFASTHKVFSRKELILNLKSQNQLENPASLSEQLNRLLKSGQLIRLEHGIYTLPDKTKKDFSIICSEEMKRINQQLKTQFPYCCLLHLAGINAVALHAPYTQLSFFAC